MPRRSCGRFLYIEIKFVNSRTSKVGCRYLLTHVIYNTFMIHAGRSHQTKVESTLSDTAVLLSGVVQGSGTVSYTHLTLPTKRIV